MWSWTTVRLGGSEGGDDDKDQDDRGTAEIGTCRPKYVPSRQQLKPLLGTLWRGQAIGYNDGPECLWICEMGYCASRLTCGVWGRGKRETLPKSCGLGVIGSCVTFIIQSVETVSSRQLPVRHERVVDHNTGYANSPSGFKQPMTPAQPTTCVAREP